MEYFFYVFLFLSLYFQIFLLVSFFEKKEQGLPQKGALAPQDYLTTTIIVPCFNEETTVQRTLHSLLALDYPKDKLTIMAVDDGSTDGTWEALQEFSDESNIVLLQKENEGSKFAALNFALNHIDSDLVGVLDADSWVSSNALSEYMTHFRDAETMAVIPSMVIAEPDNLVRKAQKAEYDIGLFARKAFDNINAIYITPGPFSVFRKKVFDTLGPYREAHHTEDAEIALRMQKHHYKIAYSEVSVVYTVGPRTIPALIKQRVRWVYGFIKNIIDYRELFFKREYGSLGFIVLPMGFFRIFITVLLFPLSLWLIVRPLVTFIQKFIVVGYHPHVDFSLHFFYWNTNEVQLFTLIGLGLTLITLWFGREILQYKKKFGIDVVYMFVMYTFIAPLWLTKSVWNALWSKKESWR